MKTITRHLVPNAGVLILVALLLTQAASAVQELTPPQPEAAAQPLISYQGTLTDENGNPVNATVTMEFALYDASSVGNLKWGPETQTVQVANGLFSVLLGSVTPINPSNLTGDLWLDIKVNGEQLIPREHLTGVLNALSGTGTPFMVNGYVRVSQLPDPQNGGVLQLENATSGNNWTIPIRAVDNDKLTFFFYDASTLAWQTAMTLNRDGNLTVNGALGVGAATTTHPLKVTNSWAILGLDTWEVNQDAGVQFLEDSVIKWHLFNDASEGNRLTIGSEGQLFATVPQSGEASVWRPLSLYGSLGIGTTSDYEASVMIQSNAVPLKFKESDQTGAGSLWRMPLDGTHLRFDASENGTDFSAFNTPLTLYPDGSVGCGALTEANLQTEEERAAGRSDRFEEGDVLCWSPKAQRLEKCATPSDPLVQAVADKSGRPIVIGAEAVKVIGPVCTGDYLVASSVPGYAMASATPTFGIVIAQALEDFDGERGIIKAMIRKM